MKIELKENILNITREKGDKWQGESELLHNIKKALNGKGFDFIKKLMWKDGHLVDDRQHYIRARKLPAKAGEIESIWDTSWQIRGTHEPYNAFETLTLAINRV